MSPFVWVLFFLGLLLCLRGGGQQSVDLIRSIERVGLGVSLSAQTPFHEKNVTSDTFLFAQTGTTLVYICIFL